MTTLSRYIIITILLLSALGCTGSQEVGKILKAHFKAAGGLERLNEIKTVRRSGEAKMNSDRIFGLTAKFEEAVIIGEKSYSKTNYNVFTKTIVYNITEKWSTSSHEDEVVRRELSEYELAFAKTAVFISPLQSFYEEYGNSAFRFSKDETFNSKVCTVLHVAGSQVRFYIDKTSHLVSGLKMPYDDGVYEDRTMTVQYADYAEYGDVMFPDTVKASIDDPRGEARRDVGGFTKIYTYKKTEIDVTLDKKLFEKTK